MCLLESWFIGDCRCQLSGGGDPRIMFRLRRYLPTSYTYYSICNTVNLSCSVCFLFLCVVLFLLLFASWIMYVDQRIITRLIFKCRLNDLFTVSYSVIYVSTKLHVVWKRDSYFHSAILSRVSVIPYRNVTVLKLPVKCLIIIV